MFIRRCFLYLFVLLQCVAPLLHAHAGSTSHEVGIHLPLALGACPGGHSIEQVAEHPPLAITIANSLQPRDEAPVDAALLPALRLPGIPWNQAPPWTPSSPPRVASRLVHRLIPLPGDPPGA